MAEASTSEIFSAIKDFGFTLDTEKEIDFPVSRKRDVETLYEKRRTPQCLAY